jgi:guanylate kinase
MKKKIILVGKAASGKDYFSNFLGATGYKRAISHTTRPMREGEEDGREYHFISEERFLEMVDNEELREYKKFNGWYYGNTHEEFNNADSIILTPSGVNDMERMVLINSVIVYFDIPLHFRQKRMERRVGADDMERRIVADGVDFMDFTEYHIRIENPHFDCEKVLEVIKQMQCI